MSGFARRSNTDFLHGGVTLLTGKVYQKCVGSVTIEVNFKRHILLGLHRALFKVLFVLFSFLLLSDHYFLVSYSISSTKFVYKYWHCTFDYYQYLNINY